MGASAAGAAAGGATSGIGGMAGAASAFAGMPGEMGALGGMPMFPNGGGAGRRAEIAPWDDEDWPPDGDGPGRNDPDGMPAVPEGSYCEPVADWDGEDADAERQLFQVLNFARDSGFACEGSEEAFAPPLAMRPELRCSARLHSRDMSENNYLNQVNLEGVGPEDRIRDAGYTTFGVASESVAQDETVPGRAPHEVLTWLFDAGGSDCKNLVDPRFDSVGIGRYGDLWTLDFAGP